MQRVRTCAIPCPHQPPTKGDAIVSLAKVVLPPLASLTVFATGQGMKTKRAKVPACSLNSYGC